MKPSNFVSVLKEPKHRRSCFCTLFPTASLLCLVFFLGSEFIAQDDKQKLLRWGFQSMKNPKFGTCENQCRPPGSESLPEGIVSKTSNLERRPLWGLPKKEITAHNLFAVAVGTKQKTMVDKMVRKFLLNDFVVMLFHYDGNVDAWKQFEWSNLVIHVSAVNQTKWWFAKRFLHPDIVAEYNYIFLWDEDLGVEHFNPKRYLAIVEEEGLEISQPGLDTKKSEIHHQITARGRRSRVHRRTYKAGDHDSRCDYKSTKPPCTGWIEVMAPVFSRAAWRCVWYMIQNDLIHAWGLDIQLGYCAQGDRMKNVGVVDAEYIVHYGIPTLGDPKNNTKLAAATNASGMNNLASFKANESSNSGVIDYRLENLHMANSSLPSLNSNSLLSHAFLVDVRRESYNEYKVFRRRWMKAAKEDQCWIDPYPQGPRSVKGIF